MVWGSRYFQGSAGHVYVGEMDGKTILSQFPVPRAWEGVNTTKSWSETRDAEGRDPDSVYKVHIDDDEAFDREAARLRELSTWSLTPDDDEANCTSAAFSALSAGGVHTPQPWFLASPNDFKSAMDFMQRYRVGPGHDGWVMRLPGVPWQ